VRLAVLASAVLIATAAPCGAEWRRLDSPNFTVIGDVSARELRDLAVRFEGFRETVSRVISERASASAVPTVIIVFPSDRAFAPFRPTYQGKPRTDVGGFFVPGTNLNYILMQSGGVGRERIVLHEYAHLIVSNLMPNPPVWLNEGLAEYYSTFTLSENGRQAQLGLPIGDHVRLLKSTGRIPLPELLKVDAHSPLYNESARASVFYAESWALTHMILNGQPNRVQELSAYLRSVGDGVTEAAAWEQTFGTDRTETELRHYLNRDVLSMVVVDFPEKIAALSATTTTLSAGEVAAFLAAYFVQHQQYDEAAAQLKLAFEADPGNPRASVAMAQMEMATQRFGSAENRLVGLRRSDDWLATYAAATTMADLAGVGIAGSPNVELIATARRQLDVLRRDRPDLPNVLAHRAALDLAGPDDPGVDARDAIARARALAPGRSDYAFIQAQILARRGEYADARAVLGPLMSGIYSPGVRDSARSLMAYIVDAEARRAAGPQPAAASASKSVPVPGIDHPRSPDDGRPKFVPQFRAVAAGEQRSDGTLERIECTAAGRATFVLEEPAAPRPLVGKLSDVDFIAYRDDLSGGIGCGPVAQPMHVFVTWRGTADAVGEKTVVAVEFLPK
jgi:hypothetical protein